MGNGKFDGRVIVATGAASGIGAAVAERYTREGGHVAIVDLHKERAEDAAERLGGAIGLEADVSDEASVASAIEDVVRVFGKIDAVFAGAGHAEFGPIEDWTWERWSRMMNVHLGGTFLISKHALPHLRARTSGAIVNVSSVAALIAQPNNAPYGAAKAGIIGLTRQLARELAPDIRVNAVVPGKTLTGMTTPILRQGAQEVAGPGRDTTGARNLQKRYAEADEIAAVVEFLLSDEAGFITGQTVTADGGETAW